MCAQRPFVRCCFCFAHCSFSFFFSSSSFCALLLRRIFIHSLLRIFPLNVFLSLTLSCTETPLTTMYMYNLAWYSYYSIIVAAAAVYSHEMAELRWVLLSIVLLFRMAQNNNNKILTYDVVQKERRRTLAISENIQRCFSRQKRVEDETFQTTPQLNSP